MADESPTATIEQPQLTLEQEIEALRTPGTEPEKPYSQPFGDTPPVTPPVVETPAPSPIEAMDAKLAEITDAPVEPEKQTPQLSPEQQQILQIVPSPQAAQAMAETAQGYQTFTSAFAGGDFAGVETMLESWNPAATEAFKEHLYQKYVASGEWVDRWIADKEGNPVVNHGMKRLENQVRELQTRLSNEDNARNANQQQANSRQVAANYLGHVNSLFDKIEFSAADRRWVMADINARVGGNPQIRAAINGGNPSAVNAIFKQAVKEYVGRDQITAGKTQAQLAAQEQKKPLLQTSPVTQMGSLPDNIKDVPKGKEDAWLDEQLGKMVAKRR